MWIADMDFPSPPPIIEAIRRRVEQGLFGYAQPLASTIESVVAMLEERHRWKIDPSWIVWLPGLVIGLNVCRQSLRGSGRRDSSFYTDDGTPFGAPKGEYVRLNFACSRATLTEGLTRLKSAISSL